MTATAAPPKIGAQYRGTPDGHGTFTIHDVPIFATLPKGARRNAEEIGRDWMLAALARSEAQAKGGYIPPVHFAHPDSGSWKSCSFRLTRVGEAEYEGRTIDVLYADLIEVSEEMLGAINRGELPYRSIEVRDWDEPCVNALGMLSGDAPFFRFPRMIGVQIDENEKPIGAPLQMHAGYLAAFRADGKRRHLSAVFAFDKAEDDEKGDAPPPAEKDKAEMGEDEPDGDEEKSDSVSIPKKTLVALISLLTKAIEGDEDGGRNSDRDPVRDKPAEKDEEPTPEKGEEKNSMSAKTTTTLDAEAGEKFASLTAENESLKSEVAKLTARCDQLEARDADRTKTDKARAATDSAKARLRAKRVVLPADFDAKIHRFSALGDAALEDYVSTLEQSGMRDPPETFGDVVGLAAGSPETTLAESLIAKGGDAEKIRGALSAFHGFKKVAKGSKQTFEQFLAAQGIATA